jgi:hypothetical protein
VAWSRFNSYFSRLDDRDAFIDLLVGLEAAFGDGGPGETGYKIALRAALFLGTDESSRKQVFLLLKKAYDRRSSILHARGQKDPWVSANIAEVEDCLRRALIKLLKLGKDGEVPQKDSWNSFLFWPRAADDAG